MYIVLLHQKCWDLAMRLCKIKSAHCSDDVMVKSWSGSKCYEFKVLKAADLLCFSFIWQEMMT